MARVFGRGIRPGVRYESIHCYDSDRQIVRFKLYERNEPEQTDTDGENQPYKVLIDAHLCRQVRSQLGLKGEKIHATIARLLGTLNQEQEKTLQSLSVGSLYKNPVKGAPLAGDYVDPDRIYKAIELCARGYFRLEPCGFEKETEPMYQIKIQHALVKHVRVHLTEGRETLTQTISKALTYLLNTERRGVARIEGSGHRG